MIDSFDGEYEFLSNFYEQPILYIGHWFNTTEHAFQAAKAALDSDVKRIQAAKTPGQAKRLGRKIQLRSDWEAVKLQIMFDILWIKFENPDLRAKLLATGNQPLVEGNNWGDKFWGKVDGVGKNHLGIVLMDVRQKIRESIA